jgi:hypothetical protein
MPIAAYYTASNSNWLTHNFFLKNGCALPDQMSFLLTFFWRAFVFARRDRDSANDNEIAVLVLTIATKSALPSREMLLQQIIAE